MAEKEPGLFEFQYRDINGITLICRTDGCGWSSIDQITIESASGAVSESPLVKAGRQHHIEKGVGHNQFYLLMEKEEVGFVSISSGSHSGMATGL